MALGRKGRSQPAALSAFGNLRYLLRWKSDI